MRQLNQNQFHSTVKNKDGKPHQHSLTHSLQRVLVKACEMNRTQNQKGWPWRQLGPLWGTRMPESRAANFPSFAFFAWASQVIGTEPALLVLPRVKDRERQKNGFLHPPLPFLGSEDLFWVGWKPCSLIKSCHTKESISQCSTAKKKGHQTCFSHSLAVW